MTHPTQLISIVAAMARNRVIGIDNRLPWHLPDDLKHFKALTLGHHIVMGRKTYESIGRPLPGRTTVIVSRDPAYRADGCLSAGSIDAAIALCQGDDEVFFVGGANLYAQVLPRADRLYLTEIDGDYPGDAFFPRFAPADWRIAGRDRRTSPDGLAYAYVTYVREPENPGR